MSGAPTDSRKPGWSSQKRVNAGCASSANILRRAKSCGRDSCSCWMGPRAISPSSCTACGSRIASTAAFSARAVVPSSPAGVSTEARCRTKFSYASTLPASESASIGALSTPVQEVRGGNRRDVPSAGAREDAVREEVEGARLGGRGIPVLEELGQLLELRDHGLVALGFLCSPASGRMGSETVKGREEEIVWGERLGGRGAYLVSSTNAS